MGNVELAMGNVNLLTSCHRLFSATAEFNRRWRDGKMIPRDRVKTLG